MLIVPISMIFYDLDGCFLARKQKCMLAPKGWRTFLKFDECKGIENKCKFQINHDFSVIGSLFSTETAKCQALSMGIKGK